MADPRYRKLWGAVLGAPSAAAARVAAPVPTAARQLECFHLGDVLDKRGCINCPGKWIRECDLHGRCTLGDRTAGVACCATCADYTAQPAPIAPVLLASEVTEDTPVESLVRVLAQRGPGLPRGFGAWPNMLEAHRRLLDDVASKPHSCPDGLAGRGIVSCVSAKPGWSSGKNLAHGYFPAAWVLAKELRRQGSTLPITFCHLGPVEWDTYLTDLVRPLDITVIDLRQWERRYPWRILAGWESKVAAVLAASYEEVCFLDADNVPLIDPSRLFDEPSYRQHGSLFWPDYPPPADKPWIPEVVWRSLGIPAREEPDFESGQFMVDKRRCWKELQVTKTINEHSDYWYQMVFGDKTTFHLAWRKCGRDYGLVPHVPGGNGGAILQRDFQGRVIFQHCTQNKPTLAGYPKPQCLTNIAPINQHLQELRQVWTGHLWRQAVNQVDDAALESRLVGKKFLYRRIGLGERHIRLLEDHRIGLGLGRCEVSWAIQNGSLAISDIDGVLTMLLMEGPEGIWHGAWLEHERCPVMLEPA